MLLVLSALDDVSALWFVNAARTEGVPCTVLTTEALSFALRQSHWLSASGTGTSLEMASGQLVSSDTLSGVVNRLTSPPALAWSAAEPDERGYATVELHAFTVAWLSALSCPVRNRPTPDSLAGRVPPPLVLAAAATAAGLDCPPLSVGTDGATAPSEALVRGAIEQAGLAARHRQVTCLDGEVLTGQVPASLKASVTALLLSLELGESLVGVDFVVSPNRWWLAGVTPTPDLRPGGTTLVRRLLELFGADRAEVTS